MDNSGQRVFGSVQNVGPQPVIQASPAGSLGDIPATSTSGSSMNAKLGRLMLQNNEIIALLERVVELLEANQGASAS